MNKELLLAIGSVLFILGVWLIIHAERVIFQIGGLIIGGYGVYVCLVSSSKQKSADSTSNGN